LEASVPRDKVVGLSSTQVVSTHALAVTCLRRDAVQGRTSEGRNSSFHHAHKLMTLYLRLVETLDKHRGKGRQKTTVEHVHVEAGRQAIVGNVSTAPSGALSTLAHHEEKAMPILDMEATQEQAVPARGRKRTKSK
jgi:hypothetical protein